MKNNLHAKGEYQMKFEEINRLCTQALDLSLGLQESSYSNAFSVVSGDSGITIIPRLPATFIINKSLFEKIYEILSVLLYPNYTLLKQSGMNLIPLETGDIHTQRGLFFPWQKGTVQRLEIDDIESFLSKNNDTIIPLMPNVTIDFNDVTHIAISGNSGSGKSYFMCYLLHIIKKMSDVIIIDPKQDKPAIFARNHGIPAIYPTSNRTHNDFVNQINEILGNTVQTILDRQALLYENPNTELRHLTIFIDEVLAISSIASKPVKESFHNLINQIALLGRSAKVHLCLCSQRFDATAISTCARDQISLAFQLGHISFKTTQFLFESISNTEDIVLPHEIGSGIFQFTNSKYNSNVQPILTPNYKEISKNEY